jgi:hypothetical protein
MTEDPRAREIALSRSRSDRIAQSELPQVLKESLPEGWAFVVEPKRIGKSLPPPPKGRFEVKVIFSMETLGFEQAIEKLQAVLDPSLVVRVLQQAVIRSLVVNVRRRYMATMENALEMKVLEYNGRATRNSPERRMRDIDLKNRLQRTLEKLNEAQMDMDHEAADRLRKRVDQLGDLLHKRMQQGADGSTIASDRLSTMAGNRFRTSLLALLSALTDSSFVEGRVVDRGVAVGVGPLALLDRIQTPSATAALSGAGTYSRYRTFWRHVEFGTGIMRSAAKDKRNPGVGPKDTWWYGRVRAQSLHLAGTAPMNFLTTAGGDMYQEDIRDLASALTQALNQLLSK